MICSRPAIVAVFAMFLAAPPAGSKEFVAPTIIPDNDVSEVSPDVEFTLRADWKVGEKYSITLTKEREELRFGVAIYTVARSVIDVTVAERSMTGWVLIWNVTDYQRTDDAFLYSRDIDAAFLVEEMFTESPLEIATNRLGFPVDLRNRQEVTARMRSAMDEALALREADPRVRKQLKSGLDRLLTAETVETLALEDAATYYGLMGETYRGGPAAVFRSSYIPKFGPPAIESKLQVLLRRVDEENGLIHITMRDIADEEKLRQATVNWVVRKRLQRGHPVPYYVSKRPFLDRRIAEYVYDRNRGLPAEVMSEKFSLDWWSFLERRTFLLLPD